MRIRTDQPIGRFRSIGDRVRDVAFQRFDERDTRILDPGAIWEDFRIGVEHLSRWERVAVITDVEWIKQTMRLFGFLIPSATRAFAASEADSARVWIIASK